MSVLLTRHNIDLEVADKDVQQFLQLGWSRKEAVKEQPEPEKTPKAEKEQPAKKA